MIVSQDQVQQITQTQKIAPHLIQASELLQCSAAELTQAVDRELMENPALESADTSQDLCPGCPSIHRGCDRCPFSNDAVSRPAISGTTFTEIVGGQAAASPADYSQADANRRDEEGERRETWSLDLTTFYEDGQEQVIASDEVFDPLSIAPAGTSLRDHLMSSLRGMADGPDDVRLAEYLVNSLDERGWLKIDDFEAMQILSISLEQLQKGIAKLQSCDPAGIGARDLRESVLLQLRSRAEDGQGHELLTLIVERYWDELVQRRYQQIARRVRRPIEAVEEALRFLQTEISPDPAGQFREPWEYKPDSKSEAVRPDVIIRRTSTGFDVEVQGLDMPTLNVNARYRALYELLRGQSASLPPDKQEERARIIARLGAQERQHIVQYVERAHLFMKNIQQRRKTIERITRCLIDAQQGYIETGSRAFLQPMTRTELAHQACVHESTVSRALLRKYVQLPNQDVLPFEEFFTSAGSLKDTISNLIASEDPENPYSDEKIRQILEEAGHNIARRTVVKYRESMRIPASYARRRH